MMLPFINSQYVLGYRNLTNIIFDDSICLGPCTYIELRLRVSIFEYVVWTNCFNVKTLL